MFLPIIFTVIALDALGFSMTILSINPFVFSLGGTQFFLGILGSCGALTTLIWNPIAGSLSDSIGRKPVLLRCLCICLISNVMMIFSNSLTSVFIARILACFGVPIMSLIKSLIDENISDKDKKMDIINKTMAAMGCCMIFGSIIGGFLNELENGSKYIFALISCGFATNIVLVSLIEDKKKVTQTKENDDGKSAKGIQQLYRNFAKIDWSRFWDIFAVKLICDFVINVFFFSAQPTLINKFAATGRSIGLVIALKSIIAIALNLNAVKIKKYFYEHDESGLTRLLHCLVILMVSSLGICLSTNLYIYIFWMLPSSIVQTLLDTTVTEAVLTRASESEKGTTLGAFDSTFFLGGLVAPVLAGTLTDNWGDFVCTVLCCVLPTIIGTGLIYVQRQKVKTN